MLLARSDGAAWCEAAPAAALPGAESGHPAETLTTALRTALMR